MHRIEDYALIGDEQTAALVGADGSVDWLCLPRFDSAACFARLLGDESNGHWRIAPAGADRYTRRSYREDTLFLDTEWETPEGAVLVTDLMPQRHRAPDLVRIVQGVRGEVTVRSTLRLRFDYGSVVPWVRRADGHRVAVAGPDSAWLRSVPEVETWGEDRCTVSEFTVREGQRMPFTLSWHPSYEPEPPAPDPESTIEHTEAWWREWSQRRAYTGQWREAVVNLARGGGPAEQRPAA